jgi:RNA polymerase sigma-70 factor (ECF subfamily)
MLSHAILGPMPPSGGVPVPETLTWDLGPFRPALLLQARQFHLRLHPRLRCRFDASSVVQVTLQRAHAHQGSCRGTTDAEKLAWLRQILANALLDRIDHERAKKRNPFLERSIQGMLAESSASLDAYLADRTQESPSEAVERKERLLRVTAAIEQLPADQRDVVILRDLMGQPVAEIAEGLGRTQKSVAGLLERGRRQLRELLDDLRGDAP